MKKLLAAAVLASLFASNASAAVARTQFEITVELADGELHVVRLYLDPKESVKQRINGDLFLELSAPEEESGEGRSQLRLLTERKDGSFKVLHIAGLATFPNEVVQSSYGMCGGGVIYRTHIAPGARVCDVKAKPAV